MPDRNRNGKPPVKPSDRFAKLEGIEAEFAALSQQVTGLEGDYRDLKGVVVNLDRKMDAGFASLNAKIDSRNVTPWIAIYAGMSVFAGIATTIGYLALQPTRDAVARIDQSISEEGRQRRDDDRRMREQLATTKSQLDWTNGWLAGKFDFSPKFAPPLVSTPSTPR